MNLLTLLDTLAAPAPAPTTGLAPRRDLIQQLGRLGGRALLAGLPATLLGTVAQAGTNLNALDALSLLLQLENLLSAFYTQALGTAGLVPAAQLADVQLLQAQQQQHADFLLTSLRDGGITPPTAPAYDFSGSHQGANAVLFPDVFVNFDAFLQLAQQLEDASAAIYQGQALTLKSDRLLLAPVLRMHATEARHAAHLRRLRQQLNNATVKPWPSPADVALPAPVVASPSATLQASLAALAAVGTNEKNTVQVLPGPRYVPFTTILVDPSAVQTTALPEAFDEPLTFAQATALLALFR